MMKNQSGNHSNQNEIQIQTPELPKGGGAIRGLGETFAPDAFSGTGSYSIPLPLTAARGFEPHLSLSYNSGTGNGPFGLGFALSLSKIARRTEKGIPRYDADDIFVDGDNELVPQLITSGEGASVRDTRSESIEGENWQVTLYRPRVEAAYAKIEHWVSQTTKDSYWQVITKDNSTHLYGKTSQARIVDPTNPAKIFEWLIESAVDSHGNQINYNYKAENNENVPKVPWEQGRALSQKYIQSIQYGNFLDSAQNTCFAFEVVFDYGGYSLSNLKEGGSDPYTLALEGNWTYRQDAFSSYRSGFEIRTRRRCQNILIFHTLEAELGAPSLVKSMTLTYLNKQNYGAVELSDLSLLQSVQMTGYRRSGLTATDVYQSESLPDLDLSFSAFHPPANPEFKLLTITASSLAEENLTVPGFQAVDLEGEGIDGLLYTDQAGLLYMQPEGEGNYAPPQALPDFPVNQDFQQREVALVDLEGNGKLDLVVQDGQRNGFYPRNEDGSWGNYQSFADYPNQHAAPYMESVGLSANGKTDLLVAEKDTLLVYESEGKAGYQPAITKSKPTHFPIQKTASRTELVTFANLFGDGLSHRIKISNGLLECWPDLGYGNFGEKITLGDAPFFGDSFDISRLHLADINGSGTPDLLYVHPTKIELFINQSGNQFSDGISITLPETFSSIDQISFADIKGNGTACLLFTKMADQPRHYYYNFVGESLLNGERQASLKPYLLNQINNNLGAITQMHYTSSTKFYLADKKANRPWATKIHFPVQVVEKVTTIDEISGAQFVQTFAYHDGYYDTVEREFRGFAYVESWDTQTYQAYSKNSSTGKTTTQPLPESLYVPPVYSRSWYHTGAFEQASALRAAYKKEQFQGDPEAYQLPACLFGTGCNANPETLRQAHVALKGHLICQEVYAEDQTPEAKNPYTVAESNVEVRLIQAASQEMASHAVFMVLPHESIHYQYERNPADPRTSQSFTLAVDDFGNVTQSADIVLPRRSSLPNTIVHKEQKKLQGTLKLNAFINETQDAWLLGVAYESQDFELCGLSLPTTGGAYFSFDAITAQATSALKNIQPYTGSIDNQGSTDNVISNPQARQLSWSQHYFWNAAQNAALELGSISPQALLHHQETAEFTQETIDNLFAGRLTQSTVKDLGGYVFNTENNYWWNQGLVKYYYSNIGQPGSYYLPQYTENSFVASSSSLYAKTSQSYDPYYLHPIEVCDYVDQGIDNTTTFIIDYITGSPQQVTDLNGNVSQVLFDPLGQVIVSSHFGQQAGQLTGGMRLYTASKTEAAEYTPRTHTATNTPINLADVISNSDYYLQGAASYFYYDLHSWKTVKQPVGSVSLVNKNYYHTANTTDTLPSVPCQIMVAYTDGLGRSLEKKLKTDPGLALLIEGQDLSATATTSLAEGQTTNRWQVTGRVVYNNKGKPCEKYLPYFSNTADFELQSQLLDAHLPPPTILHYDPLLRVIRVDTPKGFFSKVTFTPWQESHYDENDTLLESAYYQNFMTSYPEKPSPSQMAEKQTLEKSALFYNTPATKILNNLGHVFLEVENNLGNVSQAAFAGILPGTATVTSADIWQALQSEGYLEKESLQPGGSNQDFYWLTSKFQPYQKGFSLDLPDQFKAYLPAIIATLQQNSLTTYHQSDILGRSIQSIDPRLYYSNQSQGTAYYNFKYAYTMGDKHPVYTNSSDGGIVQHFSDIYGDQLWSWNARDYCQLISYDHLRRKSTVQVKKVTTAGPVTTYDDFNLVEVFTYGESQPNSKANNLRGKLYQLQDLSGVVLNPSYTIQGKPVTMSRQLVQAYETAVDWRTDVSLETDTYSSYFTYDALGQPLSETTPDGSITSNTYNQTGKLYAVQVTYNQDNTTSQSIIEQIQYDAKDQRTSIQYGNGITTSYTYEPSTLRLESLVSSKKALRNSQVQNLSYTYDPVGNISQLRDLTQQIVFYNNQKVVPVSSYTYDALYRLEKATGRQHPGINANTYKNDSPAFKQSMYAPLPSTNQAEALENYSETYSYDNSGNLIQKKHQAKSSSWTRKTPVEANSNRLLNFEYDDSGNQRTLDINPTGASAVNLSFNCCNNLVKAGVILRPEKGQDDCDYYLYDSGEQRTRKINISQTNTGSLRQEKIYLGNYEIKRNQTVTSAGQATTSLDRQTLRVMDDKSCVAIIHYWVKDDTKTEVNQPSTRSIRFQMANHQESVSLEMDAQAQLISYEEYFPYGGTAIIAGKNQKEVKLKDYRYSGKERDDSTGLYYYGFRYYAPWLGRWLNPDPAGTVDGMNLFAFVRGNPVTATDEDGLASRKSSRKRAEPIGGRPATTGSDADGETGDEDEEEKEYSGLKEILVKIKRSHKEGHVFAAGRKTKLGTKDRVMPKATMAKERQLVRHLATHLLSEVNKRTEVQVAVRNSDSTIHIAVNARRDTRLENFRGRTLGDLLEDAGTMSGTSDGRIKRHVKALYDVDLPKYRDYEIRFISNGLVQHAETKIEASLAGDYDYVGGTRRPCLGCWVYFKKRRVDPKKFNPHHGPFWPTTSGTLALSTLTVHEQGKSWDWDDINYYNEGLKLESTRFLLARTQCDTDSCDSG